MKTNWIAYMEDDPVWSKKSLIDIQDSLKKIPPTARELMDKSFWKAGIEFTVTYNGRAAFLHYNSNFDGYVPLLTAGVNLYPFNDQNLALGFSYNDGANPIDGTKKQTYWLMSLTHKE